MKTIIRRVALLWKHYKNEKKSPKKHALLSSRESLFYKNNLTKVEERISHITSKFKCQQTRLIPAEKEVLNCLIDLLKTLVVIPIDKASSNIAIICKTSYVHKILIEVAIYCDHTGTCHLSNKFSKTAIGLEPTTT